MKTTIYSIALLLVLIAAQGCTAEIPDDDTKAPIFTFAIEGDGFRHSFNSNEDFSSFVLNLRSDVVYDFSFTGYDLGGVRYMYIDAPDGRITVPFGSPWEEYRDGYYWFGDMDAPFTAGGVDGTLAFYSFGGPEVDHVRQTELLLGVEDYGGTSGIPNYALGLLKLDVRDHPTEIVPID